MKNLIDTLSKFSKDSSSIKLSVSMFDSPIGKVIAAADDNLLYLVSFEDSKNLNKKLQALRQELSCCFEMNEKNVVLKQLKGEFKEYFEGKLKKFTVPLKTIGSEFQKEVWEELQELPYSSTQSYGDLAKVMGRPASHARAIGAACGANAHLLVIPCHTLVAAGSKGGFNSGVDRKEWLLEHEKKHCTQ